MKTFKAGRELDALVALKVMGCKQRSFEHKGHAIILCDCPEVDYKRPHGRTDGYGDPNPELAQYSTDRALALELLEKFTGGWLHAEGTLWRAGFGPCPYSDERGYDRDPEPQETPALAIAIATLLYACTKDCPTCKGDGQIPHKTAAGYSEMCSECHGDKRVSDGFLEAL